MSSPLPAPTEAVGVLAVSTPVGTLHVDALSDTVLRVRLVRDGGTLSDRLSYAIDPEARWDGPSEWVVREGDWTEAETAALQIRVEAESGAFVVTDRHSDHVLVETGRLVAEGVGHSVRLHSADRLFGLGDKAFRLDRRGHAVTLWNTDAFKYQRGTDPLYKSVPFVLKQGAETNVGLFYDNTFRSRFDLGAWMDDWLHYESAGGDLDLYILHAPTALGVVESYARLTGRTPMLPKWALGYHQCRYSYMDEADIRGVAEGFRSRDIPCDALYFDIHYMDGYRVFTWDRERFPDPPALIGDLASDGFRSVVIVDPGVKADDPDYDVYQRGQDIDAYVTYPDGGEVHGEVWPGRCAFPDFTAPHVRDWWGALHGGLVRDGVAGFWNDMNEPALFSVAHVEGSMNAEEGVGTIPLDARHAMEGAGGTHAEAHNVYGMQMQRATYDGLRELAPTRRPFTITRASYAGAQRFGTSWTGDNTATWDHLTLAVQTCLSLGVSGMTFTGTDVGGFVGTPSGELLARWTQVGALTPLFRNHSAVDTPRQEPWLFGEEVERVCKEAIELRYRLLPVLYTALWQAAAHGTPMLRPLPLVHPDDATIRGTSPLGFYVGDHLLAHPVLVEGQTEREVYLPEADGGWFDLHTSEWHAGRQTLWTDTPLDRIPLYVRAGAVLPLAPVRPHTGVPVERLTLHVFPAVGRTTSWLFEDEGDGYGDTWVGRLDLSDDGETLGVTCAATGRHEPEWVAWEVVIHGLAGAPALVSVDGAEVEATWDGAARFTVPVGASFEIQRG